MQFFPRAHALIFLTTLTITACWAQNAAPPADSAPTEDKRIAGILPNYRTTDGTVPYEPITAKQKLGIAAKDSFDWPAYVLSASFAGFYQLENSNPSFGQGAAGYARRFGTAFGDQCIGNMMAEGFVPAAFHQDPRYFRKINGTVKERLFYSLAQLFVARSDHGGRMFNFGEVLGNGIGASVANAYYPDNRGFGDTISRMGIAIGTDGASNILKEFWPDIKKHFRQPANGTKN